MNYAKAKKECDANHDIVMQCISCGWTRPGCDHRFSVVVEWKEVPFLKNGREATHEEIQENVSIHTYRKRATKLACEKGCGEIKSL